MNMTHEDYEQYVQIFEHNKFDEQIERYMDECSQRNVDIVGMNTILTREKRWYEYDTLVAENKFVDNGTHLGISRRVYAVIMEKLNRKKLPTDVLVESNEIGKKRVEELQNQSNKKHYSYG